MTAATNLPNGPIRVLIAEDSATQAQRLQHILEARGYRVTATPNGRLALEAARREPPSLIISDVVMPEMNGYELCRQVKDEPLLDGVAVILVTTLSDPQDVIRGLECRADNFILKPYHEEQLLRRIEFVLTNRKMQHADRPGKGLEIVFSGQKHCITADRLQILNLLLSTYEAAIQRNDELSSTRDTLHKTNQELKCLTQQLEERVQARTRELEQSNTALRHAQQALIQQERLSALGQMASGIAHDINNAVSPVALYTSSLLKHEQNLSTRAREQLLTIQRAIDDVAQTVTRMREFYRPQEATTRMANVELNVLVQQVLDLTRARWCDQPQRKGIVIDIKTELAVDLPLISGAENEIRDAITNLVFNAVDAMPAGGVIVLRTSTRGVSALDAGGANQVELAVRDTGVGMNEETRHRCLEPFFTTKGERGTGLGLAMVYGMAQRHGATVKIDSSPGQGTAVRILFPLAVSAASTMGVRKPQLEAAVRSLRILLIDDNVALSAALNEALESEGHRVTAASGGEAGIAAFNASLAGQRFDVVITDLGMPYVDGRQVAAAVRTAAPDTPIILLTGWGQQLAADHEGPLQVDRLLSKPPRLAELRTALAELTGSRS